MTGVIKTLNRSKMYGFIRGEDEKEYFFHKSAVKNGDFNKLEVGQEVTFEDAEGERGLRAEDIYV